MLTLTTRTNKGKETIACPICWEEATTKHYLRIRKEWDGQNWVQLFSILSGKDYDGISESKDLSLETALYNAIRFVFEQPRDFEKGDLPGFITINGKTVHIPRKIGRLTIGQNIKAKQELAKLEDLIEGIALVTAIYLQPLIDEDTFDFERAKEIEKHLLEMPITKVYPLGFFLLMRLSSYGSRLTRGLNRMKRTLIKSVKLFHRSQTQKGLNHLQT